ncbi:MAG TPA: 30S ribosomal protein S2 [Candidatus Saccharimonadales bacterium]|nr:30S ribosomal protein S2 [Candidatus Saccharimonadales bacterium]
MRTVSLEELLEAGCHFGHQVSRQNAKAREYIFEPRDGIHIIDLEKTKEGLEEAAKFVKEIAKKNGTLLVLGTKRQAIGVLDEERKNLEKEGVDGVYFVTKRWIGGTLTNYSEVAKNYKKLKDIAIKVKDPASRSKFTKKELSDMDKMRQKLEGFYGGIADMPAVPDAIFIVDTHEEHVAANEAVIAGIPTVGITDTNADPTIITYPIPANDDAVGSIKLITDYIFAAWIEGKKNKQEAAAPKASTPSSGQEKEEKKETVEKKKETPKEDKKEVKSEKAAEKKKEAPKKPSTKK